MRNYALIVELYNTLVNSPTFEKKDGVDELIDMFEEKKRFIRRNHMEFNPCHVTELANILFSLQKIVFGFTYGEFLVQLLDYFGEMYPEETKHIEKYLDVYNFGKENKQNILLKGDIQSGKTAMMILTSLCYLVNDRDVIILLRNKLDDKEQLRERFEEFVSRLKEEKGYTHPNFIVVDKKDKTPVHSCLFVEIYRQDNINKLLSKLRHRNINNAVLYTDEADIRDDLKDIVYNKLYSQVGTNIFVSATVQDILVSDWGIKGSCIIPLFRSQKYKGLDQLDIIERKGLDEPIELFYTFCDIAIDNDFQRVRPEHPKIVLLTLDRYIAYISTMFENFKRNQFVIDSQSYVLPKEMENICAIEYTGKGIQLYHPSLINKIDSLRQELIVRTFANNNTVQFGKKESIKKVLLWLAQNGGVQDFPNIVIVAGDMASRGINFACYDDFEPKNNWHLTHQVLLKPDSTSSANTIQACRILGNHGDDIPLKLYTIPNSAEKIKKGYILSTELVNCITNKDHKLFKEEFLEKNTDDICREIPIRKKDKPEKFLARKNEKKVFHLVEDDDKEAIPLGEEDDTEEYFDGDGWLQCGKSLIQKELYNTLLQMLMERGPNKWIKRRDLLHNIQRNWDLRDLTKMHQDKKRKDSRIKYRKNGILVEYKLVHN